MAKLAIGTINEVFLQASARGDAPAWMWLDADGQWKTISSVKVYGRVRALAGLWRGWAWAGGTGSRS